jgi:NAD(P)-dependent dehydrogenase (short-subunit alcohol dehydrogenase family)
MQELTGKVAVVTGAASGIGLAMAHRFAREGMSVVLADIEADALARAAGDVGAGGARTLAVRTDVSHLGDVESLAARTLDAFGAVHIVCNNAGVALSGPAWSFTAADWQWVLGVNLWGVIHGVRVFTPILLAQQGEAHVVNTASMAGVTSAPGMAAYNVTKHGVVALSETLHQDLALLNAAVKVSVLCPSFTNTRILDSARNRPAALADTDQPEQNATRQLGRQLLSAGQSPDEVVDAVIDAIRSERFYVFPYPRWRDRVRARFEDMLGERGPSPMRVEDFLR